MSITRNGPKKLRKTLRELSEDEEGRFVRLKVGDLFSRVPNEFRKGLALFSEYALDCDPAAIPLVMTVGEPNEHGVRVIWLSPRKGALVVSGNEGAVVVATEARSGFAIWLDCLPVSQ